MLIVVLPVSCVHGAFQGGDPPKVNFSQPNDILFIQNMIKAAPDLYEYVNYFASHPYPWGDQPFASPLGRAGAAHYQAQVNATGHQELPVLITEAGWRDGTAAEKANSIVAAYSELWLHDPAVAGVMPFLAADGQPPLFTGLAWVDVNSSEAATFSAQYNATRALRCSLGIGGPC